MGIAGMVVWVLTAGIGVYVLTAGMAAHRRSAGPATAAAVTGPESLPEVDESPALVGAAALAVVVSGDPAGGGIAVEGSPLLEFTHPALALLGLTFWIFFVMTGDGVFAWVAFGVVVATVAAGLTWEVTRRRRARGRGDGPRGEADFPAHLVALHGLAAACTLALVVIGAVTASRA